MKKIIIIPLIFILLFSAGCADFLDVNHNPNVTEDSRIDLVFPSGVENLAGTTGNSFRSLGSIWAQHLTSEVNQPGFMGEDSYSVQSGDYSYDLRGWSSIYAGTLMDFEWVKIRATEQENWNYYLMATVMQCYTYQILADLWDQIPVSSALQKVPGVFQPGPEVYDTLIQRIDFALAKDLSAATNTKPGIDDVVFNGNMTNWIAFANTLKLKMYIRERFARPAHSLDGINALYSAGASFLNVDAKFKDFSTQVGKGNYWFESNYRTGEGALVASNTFLTYLVKNNDPRGNELFLAPSGDVHKGMWQGDYRDNFASYGEGELVFSKPIIEVLDPVYFISAVESKFLQAEAQMMRNAGAAVVEALYIEAINLNCANLGGDAPSMAETNIYGSTGYAIFPTAGTKTEQYEMLMMQKWIALADGQNLEAFFERNRSGIPKISAKSPGDDGWSNDSYLGGEFLNSVQSVLPRGVFPKRLLYSATERSKNPNVPATEEIYVPVWWEVANPSVE